MIEQLILKISLLIDKLDNDNNKSSSFFLAIKQELEKDGLSKQVISKLQNCFSITQYSNFSIEQENLLSQIIDLIKIVPSNNHSNCSLSDWKWAEDSILSSYNEYTPCKDIFQATCDEIGRYFEHKGFKYTRSRPKITYNNQYIKLEISFWSSRSNTPGKWVNMEIIPSFYSLELVKAYSEKGLKSKGYILGFMDLLNKKLEGVPIGTIKVQNIYGELNERIEDWKDYSEYSYNKNVDVYGLTIEKFKKIIKFIEDKINVWIDWIHDSNKIRTLVMESGPSARWSFQNGEFMNFIELKYPELRNEINEIITTNR